jgi:ectoine hydroxylase-related dioxygenase (phytanoyl-CoA dioxygenase family)
MANSILAHEHGATAATSELASRGYCVLHDIVAPAVIGAIGRDLSRRFADTPFCRGGFYGPRTKRFGGLLKRSDHATELVQNPVILDLARAVLEPWCDVIQLNLAQALELHPGAPAQFPHRDQDMWRGATGEIEYLVNVMWPLTPYRRENGATLIWPGSQNGGDAEAQDRDPLAIECDPGSAIVFLGSTLHGAGANASLDVRRGIIVSYCLGWLKPYENQWLVYPPAVARRFPPNLAELVGYRQHRPNLGNYEGQCPSVLLRDGLAEHLAATDALRPDQEAALTDFLGRQQAVPR